MNIKEHIEAGHYPTDDKGRALVPMHGGGTATVGAICDHNNLPLLGWSDRSAYTWWDRQGRNRDSDGLRLLPPMPRKALYTLCIPWRDGARDLHRKIDVLDGDCTANSTHNKEWRYVLCTDAIEEPWE